MAVIRIVDLKVRAIIGAHPWEKINKQELVLNISVEYDAAKASQSDSLKDALNYEALAQKVIKLVERSQYALLEKLIAKVKGLLMADKRIDRIFIRIDKPQAIAQARCVSLELWASRI